jgi:prepilin peptidase CpaA
MVEMWSGLETIVIGAAAGLFLLAAWQDFRSWKIRNWTILALLAAYAGFVLVRWISGSFAGGVLLGEMGAGLLLFVLGFTLWMFGLFGAGDAKLLLPVGLFVGFSWLTPFALALMVAAVAVFLALRFPIPAIYLVWPVVARLDEIRQTGKVPYGVVITAAALVAMYLRFSAGGF